MREQSSSPYQFSKSHWYQLMWCWWSCTQSTWNMIQTNCTWIISTCASSSTEPLTAMRTAIPHSPPHQTNIENFSTVQSKSFWSSELLWIIILLVIGVYCSIFKLQKNYLSNRKDMFALEIILHLLDFAFGFCCYFIYISALSNTLLHMIEQVRKISVEGKHLEGRLWGLW